MTDQNQDRQKLATPVDPAPEGAAPNGMRGEGHGDGSPSADTRHVTMLAGKPVEVAEDSGVAFAETDAGSVTGVDGSKAD